MNVAEDAAGGVIRAAWGAEVKAGVVSVAHGAKHKVEVVVAARGAGGVKVIERAVGPPWLAVRPSAFATRAGGPHGGSV
jgi:hypothetical protein